MADENRRKRRRSGGIASGKKPDQGANGTRPAFRLARKSLLATPAGGPPDQGAREPADGEPDEREDQDRLDDRGELDAGAQRLERGDTAEQHASEDHAAQRVSRCLGQGTRSSLPCRVQRIMRSLTGSPVRRLQASPYRRSCSR